MIVTLAPIMRLVDLAWSALAACVLPRRRFCLLADHERNLSKWERDLVARRMA